MKRTAAIVLVLLSAVAGSAATLNQTLSCGRPGEAGGLGAGTDLTRATIDTRRYPEAVCNDGTPGVYYVSPASRAEDRNKWVIFLQGGGGCVDGDDCASRWCSAGTNFGMDKMSSSLSKQNIRGNGIFDRRADNQFGGWNHVLIYYCSSDNWAGNKSRTLSASNGTSSVEYDIHFRGSRIVDAVIDMLRRPRRTRIVRPGNEPLAALPDLDDATQVLFAGSSAGGGGTRNNADIVGTVLRANNVHCSGASGCPLDYRVAVDASFGPDSSETDFSNATFCLSPEKLCTYEDVFAARYRDVIVGMWGARFDDSCVAWHTGNAPGTEWLCADGEHLFANHLSTELFARQDLQDQLISGNFEEARLGSREDFGRLMEADLREYPTLPGRAEEGGASDGKNIAVFAPQCTDHESFTNNRAFFNVRVEHDGTGYSFHDVLWNWWSRSFPQVVIRQFTGQRGSAPECP